MAINGGGFDDMQWTVEACALKKIWARYRLCHSVRLLAHVRAESCMRTGNRLRDIFSVCHF